MMFPNIKLSNNNIIPQVGLGLWQVKDAKEFEDAFSYAIKDGYRHFDTAQAYDNEHLLGSAWSRSGLKRDEIFITTKIFISHFSPNSLQSSFKDSLQRLKTDHVDLLLLHFPVPIQRKKAWLELEKLHKDGLAKNIGVSNYMIKHLEEMNDYANEKPVINQYEMHVFLQQPELHKYCQDNNIQIEAYSPLARAHILDNPTIINIAKKYNKTYAQVMLRFLVQQKIVIIPKSKTPTRIKQNINLFDFKLDEIDMSELKKQDKEKRFCWSPARIP